MNDSPMWYNNTVLDNRPEVPERNSNNPHTSPARMKPAQALHIPKGVMVGDPKAVSSRA